MIATRTIPISSSCLFSYVVETTSNTFSVCSITWRKTTLNTFLIIFSSFASKNRRCISRQSDDVPLVEFMYLAFTRMPSESYNE